MPRHEQPPAVPPDIILKTTRPDAYGPMSLIDPGDGLALDSGTGDELFSLLRRAPGDPESWRHSGVQFIDGSDPYKIVACEAFGTAAINEQQAAELTYSVNKLDPTGDAFARLSAKLTPSRLYSAIQRAWLTQDADPHAVARLNVIGYHVYSEEDFVMATESLMRISRRAAPFVGRASLVMSTLLPRGAISNAFKINHDVATIIPGHHDFY